MHIACCPLSRLWHASTPWQGVWWCVLVCTGLQRVLNRPGSNWIRCRKSPPCSWRPLWPGRACAFCPGRCVLSCVPVPRHGVCATSCAATGVSGGAVSPVVIGPVRPAITGVTVPPGSESTWWWARARVGGECGAGQQPGGVGLRAPRQIRLGLEEVCCGVLFAQEGKDDIVVLLPHGQGPPVCFLCPVAHVAWTGAVQEAFGAR